MNRIARRLHIVLLAIAAALLSTAGLHPSWAESDGPDIATKSPYATVAERITPKQINRIRFMELRAAREKAVGTDDLPVDRVVVQIPKDTIERFLTWKQGSPGFQGERARKRFLKMTPPEKLAVIAYWARETPDEFSYADSVEIKTDPEVMVEFRRRLMPPLLANCATANCHGSSNVEAVKMRLYNDAKRSDATTYANFVTLREWVVNGRPLIDPRNPEKSLLLAYTLRTDMTPDHHPGKQPIKPMFQRGNEVGYKHLEKWIVSLRQLHEVDGYGFHLLPTRAVSSAPAGALEPADDESP